MLQCCNGEPVVLPYPRYQTDLPLNSQRERVM